MKHFLVAICFGFLMVNQALALSCPATSIEDSYISHSKAEEQYVLVKGKLINKRNVVLGPLTPGVGARSENFTATFVGRQATRSGFSRRIRTTVAVSGECGGPWCGSVTMATPMMTFLQLTPHGHEITVGPCGGSVFYNPTKDQSERVLQCLRGGVCQPQSR